MTRMTAGVLLTVLGMYLSLPAFTAGIPDKFRTPAGVVEVREATGAECGTDLSECKAVEVGGKVIVSDSIASVDAVFPSSGRPQMLSLSTATGGNACCWETYILDVSRSSPILMKHFSFTTKILSSKEEVIFFSPMDDDELGDPTMGTYRYPLGTGKPILVKRFSIYTSSPLDQKKYPWDVLGDPKFRGPILTIVGRSYFHKFRNALGVASQTDLRIIQGRYIVGSGCMPHDCGSHRGIFVIDQSEKLAWCAEYSEGYPASALGPGEPTWGKLWGVLRPEDITPKNLISDWLLKMKITWDELTPVPLPSDITKLYGVPSSDLSRSPPEAGGGSDREALVQSFPVGGQKGGSSTFVQMQQDGGVYVVPVAINGALTIPFVVDSGAADVSIPADVVLTLIRTNTIMPSDFLGTQQYTLADGSTVPSTTFRIRSLKVGAITLENVVGSVADVRSTPLLGQSFLGRFKSWSIDNSQHRFVLLTQGVSVTPQDLPETTNFGRPSDSATSGGEVANTKPELEVVRRFYEALRLGNGLAASMLVIPEKRASGPFSAVRLTEYYSSLRQPIHLISEQNSIGSTVEVQYAYLKPNGGACRASAVVAFDYRNGSDSPLINGIRVVHGNC